MKDPVEHAALGDTELSFLIGTLEDGRVLLDFRRMVDHLKLTVEQTFQLAEGLIEAAKQANAGRHIVTGTALNPNRRN